MATTKQITITEYNGKKLMNGGGAIKIQVGIDSSANSTITLENSLFAAATTNSLTGKTAAHQRTGAV